MSQDEQNRPKPFSKERTKATICKVIFFYSVFFVVMKVFAALQGNAPLANIVLALPYVLFGYIGLMMTKRDQYHWWYVIVGILLISFVRYYEFEILQYLNENYG